MRAFAAACAVTLLLVASTAAADALVVVKVRTPQGKPADGRVTLSPTGEGEGRSCETAEGQCRIEGVPGGRYRVRLEPATGEAPPPRTVMVPPSGRVELIVSTEHD